MMRLQSAGICRPKQSPGRFCSRRGASGVKSDAGFTLIELMIVIAIMAILMAILIPNMVRARYQANLTGCEANEKNIATALEEYDTDWNHYPAALTPQFFQKETGKAPPRCPSSNTTYGYTPPSTGAHDYSVFCKGGLHYLVLPQVSKGFPVYNPEYGMRLSPL